MICFADEITRLEVMSMWKTCFGDSDRYMDVYFRNKYQDEQTLVYLDEGKAVASLQMLPYQFTFHGNEIPVLYLSGVCTLPEARNKGFMPQLLLYSFEVAKERGYPLMLLVPQEQWLFNYYARFGFAQTFDLGSEPIYTLNEAFDEHTIDFDAAYKAFDAHYRKQDMTIQKSFDDFYTMLEVAALYDFPVKYNLFGMSRIIDAEALLTSYAASHKEARFSVRLHDVQIESNSTLFTVSDGLAVRGHEPIAPMLDVSVKNLIQMLMGYHIEKWGEPFVSFFPSRSPALHYMLE